MDNHMDNMFEKKLQAAMAAPPPDEAFVTGLMKRIVSENSVPQKERYSISRRCTFPGQFRHSWY